MVSLDERIRTEVYRSKLPALANERVFNFRDMLFVTTAWSIATWLFVMGAWQAFAVPLHLAIIATLFGCTVPLLFSGLIGRFYTRWGVDMAFGGRATYGPLGNKVIILQSQTKKKRRH